MMQVYPIPCGLGIAFLVETGQGLFLIDSGSPGQQNRVLAKMRELGRADLKLIWITHAHYDHYGSAAALRALTGARIGVHPADADSMVSGQSPLGSWRSYGFIYPLAQSLVNRIQPLPATPPDFTLADGQTLQSFGLNAMVLHTPGHTPGHTCLLLEDGTAFVADLIGGFPQPRLQGLLATQWSQLPGSLAHLLESRPEWIFTGHVRHKLPGSLLKKVLRR
jgi:glyoxylase-like metal-dependent hydrolase (beta-lactamase superfamily II)